MAPNYLESVREHYEALPYPRRDPADESKRLIQTVGDNLLVANHFCFRGQRDFRRGFRCFVAGGGTGDSVIYLAEQLRFFDAEIVYLDLSAASRAVAEERARRRGLTNIRWITGSIMDIPQLGLGQFDYINCSGVLHHLESTEAGLAALNSVLKDDGAMFLMLYGTYARREVYDMQELLRNYLPPGLGIAQKIASSRALLANLPATNGFKRNIGMWEWEFGADGFGDAGFYDLLLHSQDRSFSVAEIYSLAAGEGLRVAGFPMRGERYDPCKLITDPEVRRQLSLLPVPRQQALAERISCVLRTHEFYLTRHSDTAATLDDEGNALLLFWSLLGRQRWLAERLQPGQPFTYEDGDRAFTVSGNEICKVLLTCMDGNTPIATMYERVVAAVPGSSVELARQELRRIFDFLHPAGYLYILAPGSHATRLPDYRRSEYVG
ncbi:MAG: methyltransferase [Gammaproteobacteria bacterium]|nr:MAG: methyltransferase [Gammaproteobacteria bacterium]